MAYGPIRSLNASGSDQIMRNWAEAAAQTFKQGVPLRLASGFAQACDTADPWTAADVVLGISAEPGHNLTAAGTAQQGYSEATPPNQPNASIIPVGAWMRNGNVMLYPATPQALFGISLKAGQTFSQALIVTGAYYALKYDSATGFWYLDSSDTTGNNCIAEIVSGLSDDSTWVAFRIKASQRYFD